VNINKCCPEPTDVGTREKLGTSQCVLAPGKGRIAGSGEEEKKMWVNGTG